MQSNHILLKRAYSGDEDAFKKLESRKLTLTEKERIEFAKAVAKCGVTYDRSKNYPAAIKMYDWAVNLGSPDGMACRARMFQKAKGSVKNDTAAAELYDCASDLGNATAMVMRGLMYENGEGCSVDYLKAAQCYRGAAIKGNEDGKNQANRLMSRSRDMQTRYHCFMAISTADISKKFEIIRNMFDIDPEAVGSLFMEDSFIDNEEWKQVDALIADYYIAEAKELLKEKSFDLALFQIYLEKVTSASVRYMEALSFMINTLLDLVCNNKISLLEIPNVLIVVHDGIAKALEVEKAKIIDKNSYSIDYHDKHKMLKIYSEEFISFTKQIAERLRKYNRASLENKTNDDERLSKRLPDSLRDIQTELMLSKPNKVRNILESARRICNYLKSGAHSSDKKEASCCNELIEMIPRLGCGVVAVADIAVVLPTSPRKFSPR